MQDRKNFEQVNIVSLISDVNLKDSNDKVNEEHITSIEEQTPLIFWQKSKCSANAIPIPENGFNTNCKIL